MKQLRQPVWTKPIQVFLITLITVLTAGLSGLFYPSTYSPLFFLGFILAMAVVLLWLWKSSWVVYTAILIIFLPAGLLPASIQSILNRSITVLAFAIWLIDVILQRRKIYLSTTAIFMLGFIVWSLLTMLWAQNFEAAKTILQVYIMRFLLFVFLIPNQIRSLQKLNGLFFTMALSGWIFLLVSLVSLMQQGFTPGERFKVYDVNENEAGLLTLVMMLGVLWIASHSSKLSQARNTIIACSFVTISIGFIALSGSRGSALSLVVTLLSLLLYRSSRPWGKFALIILVLGIIAQPAMFITTLERFTSTTDTPLGGREVIWLAAFRLIGEHPLGGVGIGGSAVAILPYLGLVPGNTGVNGVSLHNPVLVVWSETGLVGIILYASILVSAIVSFVRHYLRYRSVHADNGLRVYFPLVGSVFLGYMTSWIKGGGMQTGYLYFLLIALLLIPRSFSTGE